MRNKKGQFTIMNIYDESEVPDHLRQYFEPAEYGLEKTPTDYVNKLVEVFREVKRVLRDDGTLWLNIGDSYSAVCSGNNGYKDGRRNRSERKSAGVVGGIKPKNLLGIPWRVAFALQDDGWYLRQDIIWCLSGGTWLYAKTKKGEMPIMLKDLVRLKPETVRLWNGSKWTQVLGWNRSSETTEKIQLVFRSGERVGCTGGHQWPTDRGLVNAKDLRVGDTILSAKLPDSYDLGTPSYLNKDLLWLIGLYLAEGSKSEDTIQISLNANEISWVDRIKDAADSVGAFVTHSVSGNGLNVRIYGKVISAVLSEFIGGKNAHDKHLNVSVWRLSNWALREIVNGYLDGDGHWDAKNKRFRIGFCRNYSLERDLRVAAARLGAKITLIPGKSEYQNGVKPSFRGEWRWSTSNHFNVKDRGEIVEISRSRARKFWDIGVEDDPHLFSLASGILTHNSKPNPMPESVKDRCTKSHEYIFLLSKSPRYYFDNEAIKEPVKSAKGNAKSFRGGGSYTGGNSFINSAAKERETNGNEVNISGLRNRRSVWAVSTKPYKGAHFATFPIDLIEPCVLAGSKPGDTILDPFAGSGTTGQAAIKHGRKSVLCELNPDYEELILDRVGKDA